jgi:hypothetical protein
MNDNAFANAMNQIAGQAEKERAQELRAQQRQVLMGRVRSVAMFLILGAALAAGYSYRTQLHDFVMAKLDTKPTINSQTSQALSAIQANAAKRDKTLEDLTK